MGLKSHTIVQGVIALVLLAAWFISARADLMMVHQSGAVAAPGLEDADAEAYCFQSQADGCWPQAALDAQRVAARLDDR
jgi:hypothetical protein